MSILRRAFGRGIASGFGLDCGGALERHTDDLWSSTDTFARALYCDSVELDRLREQLEHERAAMERVREHLSAVRADFESTREAQEQAFGAARTRLEVARSEASAARLRAKEARARAVRERLLAAQGLRETWEQVGSSLWEAVKVSAEDPDRYAARQNDAAATQ